MTHLKQSMHAFKAFKEVRPHRVGIDDDAEHLNNVAMLELTHDGRLLKDFDPLVARMVILQHLDRNILIVTTLPRPNKHTSDRFTLRNPYETLKDYEGRLGTATKGRKDDSLCSFPSGLESVTEA